jgi:RNA polymerase sigma-70 factor (ECF subfamily)
MTENPALAISEIERVFRQGYGRAVAVLVRVFRDISLVEEAVQDAFTTAVQRWPSSGLPPSPVGWIITTARNRAIDRLRRDASRDDRHAQAALLYAGGDTEEDVVDDDRLRLIFTCCHPALAPGAQVALTLRLLGGLTTDEIAAGPKCSAEARMKMSENSCRPASTAYRMSAPYSLLFNDSSVWD